MYQQDLFGQGLTRVPRPYVSREGVTGAVTSKERQVNRTGEQERALTKNLMAAVLSHDNIIAAYKQVKKNKGVAGIDQMPVGSFAACYAQAGEYLMAQLSRGSYLPHGVKQVEIPKPNGGGKRKLGIPTVTDRIIQQAIGQVLSPIYELKFSDSSYGFRPHRNAHQALRKGGEYVAEGRVFVVDIDLKINHDRLMYRLSTSIGDKRLLKLIRRYLQSGILVGGVMSQRTQRTPQGSPLSPLLSNIVLDELEKRGHNLFATPTTVTSTYEAKRQEREHARWCER